MTKDQRTSILFFLMILLFIMAGLLQSWSLALSILNLCLISAIMALGVNIQWGYAGLFNVGIMGFSAVGGLSAVLISHPPVFEAWAVGGSRLALSAVISLAITGSGFLLYRYMPKGSRRTISFMILLSLGYLLIRYVFDPAAEAIEATNPTLTGFLGGLGLPILLSWLVGAFAAAGLAWLVGKLSLGLRADYLAIATLGISEIVIAVLKNEDWLNRGVKNVIGLPRPVPYEIDLQGYPWFLNLADWLNADPTILSSLTVKLCYAFLFGVTLLLLIILSEKALTSPWGRMMRAIRDNEIAAGAMGKDVKKRHLQVFIIGSALCGLAGAMLTTLDGQFTPGSYQPLRFTFLIWIMVIVGGSGNNMGAMLGGFLIWFLWVEAEPMGYTLMSLITSGLSDDHALKDHLLDSAAHMRIILMGLVLILALRFFPCGLIPERRR